MSDERFKNRAPDVCVCSEISESSLELLIPSFPGSPRSLHLGSFTSIQSFEQNDLVLAVEYVHEHKDFLLAAETGNYKFLGYIISRGVNLQMTDHLGRNALHLAVCADNYQAVKLLLDVGVHPNVKDSVGMTPLSLSLMRSPSFKTAKLLFKHGARILPRVSPMDTGLFIQFVMMCTPTAKERRILALLLDHGAMIDDPEAPGGRQALHFAAMSNNCDLIRFLVAQGADLFLTNHRDETPREVAMSFQCKKAAALLLKFENGEEE